MATTDNFFEFAAEKSSSELKESVLDTIVPIRLTHEVERMQQEGFRVSVGDTYDSAYENPDKIFEVYNSLKSIGEEFTIRSAQRTFGIAGIATAMELGPFTQIRRTTRKYNELLRNELLYDLPTVQGGPWHQQNGKALALGTIVDAHDLRVEGSTEGQYPTMSGRLDADITDHIFGYSGSDNLQGKPLINALIDSEIEFKGRSLEASSRTAQRIMSQLENFVSSPVQDGFKDIVSYCTDSLGIRSRKEEVRQEINRHIDKTENEAPLMMSVGCGTAQPMLEVMRDLVDKNKKPYLILIDQDPVALAVAEQLARQMGLEDTIEIHCSKLFVRKGTKNSIMDIQTVLQGRKLDVCEDSGLREYFPDDMYRDLTAQIWDSLNDNGIMTTGNMNKNRPQPEFLHGLMGWPIRVRMRYMKDVARLHQQAGVPRDASRYRITQDGVYTLCFSEKSASS